MFTPFSSVFLFSEHVKMAPEETGAIAVKNQKL